MQKTVSLEDTSLASIISPDDRPIKPMRNYSDIYNDASSPDTPSLSSPYGSSSSNLNSPPSLKRKEKPESTPTKYARDRKQQPSHHARNTIQKRNSGGTKNDHWESDHDSRFPDLHSNTKGRYHGDVLAEEGHTHHDSDDSLSHYEDNSLRGNPSKSLKRPPSWRQGNKKPPTATNGSASTRSKTRSNSEEEEMSSHTPLSMKVDNT